MFDCFFEIYIKRLEECSSFRILVLSGVAIGIEERRYMPPSNVKKGEKEKMNRRRKRTRKC